VKYRMPNTVRDEEQGEDPNAQDPDDAIHNQDRGPYDPWSTDDGRMVYPIDIRNKGGQPYDVTDSEGIDRTNDDLVGTPEMGDEGERSPELGPWTGGNLPSPSDPEVSDRVHGYSPGNDLNNDGVVNEIDEYMRHQKMTPEERRHTWVQQTLHPKGLSADYLTNEIIDHKTGRVVGKLPDFQ
jgi:hypothetical protein